MKVVGIRQFRDHLSHYLKKVKEGEVIYITMHNKPVAQMAPVECVPDPAVTRMLTSGQAFWKGDKPKGNPSPPRLKKGHTIAKIVAEDRR